MLAITRRARDKLGEFLRKEAPQNPNYGSIFGVRIVLNFPNNGSQGCRCRIGIDRPRTRDVVVDIGGGAVLLDPSTMAYLRKVTAILDLSPDCAEGEIILIIERPN